MGNMYFGAIFKEIDYWHHFYESLLCILNTNCFYESINSYESYEGNSLNYMNAANPSMLFMYRAISV